MVAEARLVARVGRDALPTDAESAAAATRIEILGTGARDEVERVLREIAEVRVAKDALDL